MRNNILTMMDQPQFAVSNVSKDHHHDAHGPSRLPLPVGASRPALSRPSEGLSWRTPYMNRPLPPPPPGKKTPGPPRSLSTRPARTLPPPITIPNLIRHSVDIATPTPAAPPTPKPSPPRKVAARDIPVFVTGALGIEARTHQPDTQPDTMATDRPSTSGGPLSRKKSFFTGLQAAESTASLTTTATTSRFDKRQSKDDMFLMSNSKAAASSTSLIHRFQSFRRPTRGRLPTPDLSRSSSPMSAEVPIVIRMNTPDSLLAPQGQRQQQQQQQEEEMTIGMAVGSPIGMALGSPSLPGMTLGSPSQPRQPNPLQSNPTAITATTTTTTTTEVWKDPWASPVAREPSPRPQQLHPNFNNGQLQPAVHRQRSPMLSPASTVEVSSPQPATPKKGGGKWKMFGMFGSKRNKADKKHVVQQQIIGSSADIGPYATGAVPARSDTTIDSKKPPKHKPIVVTPSKPSFGMTETSASWAPQLQSQAPAPQNSLQVPGMSNNTSAMMTTNAGLMLDVEIPTTKMDRYSVMFGSVLGQPHQNASSLLARRQATLDRLKTISDRVEQEVLEGKLQLAEAQQAAQGQAPVMPVRRATSPVPQTAKSPGFSLFPAPPPIKAVTAQQSPTLEARSRSNTAPSMLPSPPAHQQSFDLGALRKESTTSTTAHSITTPSRAQTVTAHTASTPTLGSGRSVRGIANAFPLPKQTSPAPHLKFSRSTTNLHSHSNALASASTTSLTPSRSRDDSSVVAKLAIVAPRFIQDQSSLHFIDSPSSITSSDDGLPAPSATRAAMSKPTVPEPKWTMVSPPTTSSSSGSSSSASSSASASSSTSANTSISSISVPVAPSSVPVLTPTTAAATSKGAATAAATVAAATRIPKPVKTSTSPPRKQSHPPPSFHLRKPSAASSVSVEIDESDTVLKAAVEISIARQISISRQQRDMLRGPRRGNAAPGGGSVRVVGGSGAVRTMVSAPGVKRNNTIATSPRFRAGVGGMGAGVAVAGVDLELGKGEMLREAPGLSAAVVDEAGRRKSEMIVLEG